MVVGYNCDMNKIAMVVSGGLLAVMVALVALRANAAGALSGGFYDSTIPPIVFSAGWIDAANVGHYGGSTRTTSTAEASVSLDVYGDGFILYFAKNPAGGESLVCADAVCSSVSYYAAADLFQQSVEFSGLGEGVHTVTVTQVAGEINLDAVHVLPPVPETMVIEVTMVMPEETPEVIPYRDEWIVMEGTDDEHTVIMDYSINAGDVGLGLLMAGNLFVGLLALAKVRRNG